MTVGRQVERQALASFVDDLGAGPAALLLEGEPGIGKTLLWNEGVELARARGHPVLVCRPTGSDAELSLVGLGDLLRDVPDDAFAGLPGPQAEALQAALLRRPAGPRRPDPRAVSIATLGVLEALAADAWIVLAIDDVQWVDGATARVLAFIVRRLSNLAVGFLLSRTDPDSPLPFGIGDALAPGRLHRLLIGPVGAEELGTIVRERVGLVMSVSESRRLQQVSGGNPFFALEIARAAARGDQGVTGQSLPIPMSLREDLVRQRLGSLPMSSVDLLLVAAAAGRPSLELLRLAGGGTATRTRLQHAIDAGLVQVAGSEVHFSHPLYRSAIYAQASRTRRHTVHRRLADLTSDPEGRARHLALSADGPDETIAVALDEAATLARDRGAPGAAAELLDHAIRLTPATSATSVRRRHLVAADHRFAAGDTQDAEDHARAALQLSVPGAERADALRRVAAIEVERGAIGEARRSLEAAESEAASSLSVSAEVRRNLAELALRSGNLLIAERYARSAAESAELTDDTVLKTAATVTLLRIGLFRGSAEDALSPLDGVATEPMPSTALDLVLADAEILTAEHERARARLKPLLVDAVARGDEPAHRAALTRLAELELRDGSWDRAESYARDALALSEQLGLGRGVEAALLAYLFALQGRADDARAEAGRGLRQTDNRRALLWNLGAVGLLELSLDHAEVALRHLGRAGGVVMEMALGEPAAFPFLPDEAEALVAAGEYALAERRIRWLEERGQTLGRTSALAAAARCRGLLHANTGQLAEGLAHAERAVESYATLPMPFERARSLLALGTLRRRARQKRASREALQAAADLFEALGASIWAARAQQEQLRISGRRVSVTELTEGEARVARLAASGLTNREIARTLSMSVRTVEGHLSHTYLKLELRSRTELAVFFDRSDERPPSSPAREP